MSRCKRCGKCCIAVSFKIPNLPGEVEWLMYHGFNIVEADGNTLARIHIKCTHMKEVRGGKFKCMIYSTRPEVCRDYTCQG